MPNKIYSAVSVMYAHPLGSRSDTSEASQYPWVKNPVVSGIVPPNKYLKSTVTIMVHLDASNGALKVIPGSHNKRLTDDEVSLISQNSIPYISEVDACGIQIMKPLLLHASSKATSQKHRRVIHLEFASKQLPNGLEWAERTTLLPSP